MKFAPTETTRTDVQIGLVFEDQRTGDLRQVIYADDRVVLARDETHSTTLTPRQSFESELATRYRPRPDAGPAIDAGQYGSLRERLAEYEASEGRKASHKADALLEALDLLADRSDDQSGTGRETDEEGDGETEVPFEEIPGVGTETAARLRTQGFLTETDVRGADDGDLLAVSGVGAGTLANVREFLR